MPTLTEIREGIASNLASITGAQVSAYALANPTLPALQVTPEKIDYDTAFQRGGDYWRLRITVLVGEVSNLGAQKKLDAMISPSGALSVKAATESDDTLAGDVDRIRVTTCSGYRLYERTGQPPALGAEWEVEVWAEGTA